LYEVQEEEDFIQFFAKFQKLKDEAQTEEVLEKIEAESDFGNCEYKLMFHKPTMDRVNHLQTQMRFRLNEGHGHAMYKIGVADCGEVLGIKFEQMKETLSILFYMARNQDAKIEVQKVRRGTEENGFFTELTLDRNILRDMKQSIKITMLGCEASGKSTLIGVLVSGAKDNGQGLTREYVHKHIQEIVHGKTTKIYHHIVGFNSNGEVTNLSRFLTMPEIIQDSAKIITFIDVGGNQRYAKTLMRGLCDHYPDYALIVVDALNCAQKNIKFEKSVLDNFRIAFQFQVPVVVVLSKIDALWNQDVLEDIVYELRT
jgi:GTPase